MPLELWGLTSTGRPTRAIELTGDGREGPGASARRGPRSRSPDWARPLPGWCSPGLRPTIQVMLRTTKNTTIGLTPTVNTMSHGSAHFQMPPMACHPRFPTIQNNDQGTVARGRSSGCHRDAPRPAPAPVAQVSADAPDCGRSLRNRNRPPAPATTTRNAGAPASTKEPIRDRNRQQERDHGAQQHARHDNSPQGPGRKAVHRKKGPSRLHLVNHEPLSLGVAGCLARGWRGSPGLIPLGRRAMYR
jgi:hypothetical protein